MNRRLTELATHFLGSDSSRHPSATPEDLKELQRTARLLRTDLDRVIEDEVAGDEAFEAASDSIVRLRSSVAKRRVERDSLRYEADDAHADCLEVEHACLSEERKLNALHEELIQLRDDTKQAAADVVQTRHKTQQIKYTLETAVPDTIFRLRADLQNFQTECEIDEIRVKNLNSQRKEVTQYLETKRQQLDESKCLAAGTCKEIEDAKSQRELNLSRYEFLAEQLQRMGGKVPRDGALSSVQHLFSKMSTKDTHPRRKSVLSQSTAIKPNSVHNNPPQTDHNQIQTSASLSNLRNSQQQTQSSLTTDRLHTIPRIYQMGVTPNDIQPENNVYMKRGHQGISIMCPDDDDKSIVSALTVDETEFRSIHSMADQG
jgi:hypothetical protein